MTAVEKEKDVFVRQFADLDRQAPRHYEMQRRLGRSLFGDLSLPGERAEDWRFTSLAGLLKLPLSLAGGASAESVALPRLPAPASPTGARLVFVNGVFVRAQSRLPRSPGIAVGSLADPPAEHLRQVESMLGQVADPSDHVFTALNAGLVCDGAYILVPADQVVREPIEVIYCASAAEHATASHPRTLIAAGRHAQVTVIERYLGGDGPAYLTNAVTEIALEEGAVVDHYKVQQEGPDAYHLANSQATLQRGSNFRSHYLAFGAALARNETRVRFDGEGAIATVNGLYVGHGRQHLDNFTVIDHAQPHCESHELYKGLLDGQSQGVFNGKIFVREGAQKTDAKQTNKVMLLSDGAVINTKPQLEIFADDVRCTHGATVGQLDATQLFYLRSRGIPLDEARRILMFAFANDVIGRINVEGLRCELEALLLGEGGRRG